jgi:hypothetical protein
MKSFLKNSLVLAADLQSGAIVRKFERGDADNSGATLRTFGVVLIVLALIAVIAGGISAAATLAATQMDSPKWGGDFPTK